MANKWLCGTPQLYCSGGTTSLAPGLTHTSKTHSSPSEAFKCYKHYLISVLGYTAIGQRELRPPDGGPIEVLTKKSRFGMRLRAGKEGRYMPRPRHGHGGGILAK